MPNPIFELLYNFGIRIYGLLIFLSSMRNDKARRWLQGREGWDDELRAIRLKYWDRRIAWFQCASLGEFELARPVIESFRKEYPEFVVFLTFFSPSGYEVRKNYPHAEYISYLPMDKPNFTKTFLVILKPTVVFFIKNEFWYNYLKSISFHYSRIINICADVRYDWHQSLFKRWYFEKVFPFFTHMFVLNERSALVLSKFGYTKQTVVGDLRFDRVLMNLENRKAVPKVESFKANQKLMVFGSVWPADFELMLGLIRSKPKGWKFVIATHEIHADELNHLAKEVAVKSCFFKQDESEQLLQESTVMFLDTVGELGNVYGYADAAYVGGGFAGALHNILEPAVFGIPVFFGPKFQKYPEAVEFTELNLAFSVGGKTDFIQKWESLMNSSTDLERINIELKAVFENQRGATQKVMEGIKKLMPA